VSLFEDSLWGIALDRHGFRLIYDRRAEALHDHEVSYRWFCDRSQVIGSTIIRYYTLFPSSRDFTGVETWLGLLRQALAQPASWWLAPQRYKAGLRRAAAALSPRVAAAPSWEARLRVQRQLHSVLYEAHQYHVMKGLLAGLGMDDRQSRRAAGSCAFLVRSRRRAVRGRGPR